MVKRDESFSLIFFLPESEYMELELRSVEPQGAHEAGGAPRGVGAPPPSWTGCVKEICPRGNNKVIIYFFIS